jgi:hypothetical protein
MVYLHVLSSMHVVHLTWMHVLLVATTYQPTNIDDNHTSDLLFGRKISVDF